MLTYIETHTTDMRTHTHRQNFNIACNMYKLMLKSSGPWVRLGKQLPVHDIGNLEQHYCGVPEKSYCWFRAFWSAI